MAKRSLIMYSSWTGNTEKVAYRFKKAFEKKGWTVDMWKVDHKTDISKPLYDFKNYEFLCVGSPVVHKKPIEELISILAGSPLHPSAGGPDAAGARPPAGGPPPGAEGGPPGGPGGGPPGGSPPGGRPGTAGPEAKIVFGPESKKGVAFCTYGGMHLGPKEVEPAIALISLMMEHVPYHVVGRFACPGKHGENTGWYKDLKERPNERDLQKAETFMEEVLEDL